MDPAIKLCFMAIALEVGAVSIVLLCYMNRKFNELKWSPC